MAAVKPTQPVTLGVLATEVADIKAQLAIMVEWLETLSERLDRFAEDGTSED